jgi:hypothetical protein
VVLALAKAHLQLLAMGVNRMLFGVQVVFEK